MMKGEHRRENSNRKIIRIIKEAFVGTRLAVEERETTAYYYYYPLPTADTTTKGGWILGKDHWNQEGYHTIKETLKQSMISRIERKKKVIKK